MNNLLRLFLQNAKITAVLSSHDTSFKELTCTDVIFIQNGKCKLARCYCTDAWVALSPLGPDVVDGMVQMSNLEQVASISEFSDVASAKRFSRITDIQLGTVYSHFNSYAVQFAHDNFATDGVEVVDASFRFTPAPAVIISLRRNEVLLGMLAVDMHGGASALLRTSDELDTIVSAFNFRKSQPICKELSECITQDLQQNI